VLSDGTAVDCPTWLDIVEYNQLETNCSLCPQGLINFCATQNNDKCVQCIDGFTVNAAGDVCLKNACTAAQDTTAAGDCVNPLPNCAPGRSVLTDAGDVVCSECKPGFKMAAGKCQALPDPEHCAQVEMSNPERTCNVCEEG
jgi:hypothetical protein